MWLVFLPGEENVKKRAWVRHRSIWHMERPDSLCIFCPCFAQVGIHDILHEQLAISESTFQEPSAWRYWYLSPTYDKGGWWRVFQRLPMSPEVSVAWSLEVVGSDATN
jgi:hypothetical protein